MRIRVLFILYLLFWPTLSMAQESSSVMEKVNKAESPQLWDELSEDFEYSLRFLTFGTCQKVADSSQNPNNDFYQISRYSIELEIRPDLRLTFRRLDLSAKPRMNLEWKVWEDGGREGESDWNDDWFVNEWLARIRVTEKLFVSYGRENLQWGPSYLFSPSNPFFRDNGRSNPKREVPGMDFARIVWLPAMSWTISFIANIDEGRQEFRFFEFDKIYAMKLDYSGQEAYASMILSHQESDRNRLGAFGGWTATDALLLYGEGTISKGTDALYPKTANNPFEISIDAVYDKDLSLKGTILAGGSYTLEAGPTLTMEYVYNGSGYSDGEADLYYQLRQAAADAYYLADPIQSLSKLTLSQTADPKLRFLRRNYIMFQYNHNDIWDVLNLTFRWTQNIDDSSGQFISIVECFVGDHIQLFSIGGINSGSSDTEFGTILDRHCMIGVEYTF